MGGRGAVRGAGRGRAGVCDAGPGRWGGFVMMPSWLLPRLDPGSKTTSSDHGNKISFLCGHGHARGGERGYRTSGAHISLLGICFGLLIITLHHHHHPARLLLAGRHAKPISSALTMHTNHATHHHHHRHRHVKALQVFVHPLVRPNASNFASSSRSSSLPRPPPLSRASTQPHFQ